MNGIKHLKEYRRRFRRWQRDSKRHITSTSSTDVRHCHCCENDYTGNFCPTCGQRASSKHLTWASVNSGIMDVWGVGSRALPYTLLQLLFRPGYLIADYISGKRQVSFPPVKMLVIVALVVLLISNWLTPEQPTSEEYTEFLLFNRFIDWTSNHYDWATMFIISSLIIPTYVIFRYSPRCPRHTLPEGFFIQVFNAVQILIFILLYNIIGVFIDTEPDWISAAVTIIIFLMIYRTYMQLFGYGAWGTLWRLVMTACTGIMSLFLLIAVGFCVQLASGHDWARLEANLIRAAWYAVLAVAPMLISTLINKWLTRKTNDNKPAGHA